MQEKPDSELQDELPHVAESPEVSHRQTSLARTSGFSRGPEVAFNILHTSAIRMTGAWERGGGLHPVYGCCKSFIAPLALLGQISLLNAELFVQSVQYMWDPIV
jgi:hypothetical protein